MKLLLFLVGALICVGYLVTRNQVQKDVQAAIESNTAVVGMTVDQVKKSLGEPLATQTSKTFFGERITMTFADGSEVAFDRGKATKIQAVELNPKLRELKNAMQAQNARKPGEVRATPTPKPGAWMWKDYKNPLDPPPRR